MYCVPCSAAPAQGTTVTASVPGLPFVSEVYAGPRPDAAVVHDPELVDSTGTVVPTSVATFSTGSALIPVSTLAPGGYRLRRYVNCNVPTPTTQEQSFTVTAAAAQPSEVGTVEVAPAQIATYTVSTFTGSCTTQVPVSLVKLTFKASAGFAPFLPVAKMAVDVDGVTWASSEWGGAESSIPKSFYWAPHVYDELFTNCEASPLPYDDTGLSEGKHTATLKVWLPTQDQPLVSLPFEFTTSCADVVLPDGGARPDGAARDAQPASLDAKASTLDIAEAVPEAGSPDSSAPAVEPDARVSISLDLGSGGSTGTVDARIDEKSPPIDAAGLAEVGKQMADALVASNPDSGSGGSTGTVDSAAVAADAAAMPARTSSGGCSCSTSRNSNWPGALLVLAVVCAIRLRRARGSAR